ncbi:MAG: hypothetical protein JSV23_06775 [Promethearchaeota archaeon]|nr:MAG: hypothetical protein JSV23_06775 [Candidatus Lokiarchaeota archaeon]
MQKLSEERFNDLLLYSEQRLQHLAHVQIWKGNGTESDPFIVGNANILGQAILLKNSSLHISFINCNFDHAQFEGCQNILLDNCTFGKLVLRKCKKFKIDKSYMTDLSFSRTKDVLFKNSIILNVSTKFRIKQIFLKGCQINNSFLDYILKKNCSGLYSKIKEFITSIIIILCIFNSYRLIFLYYFLNSSEIINLLSFIGIIIALVIFLLLSLLYESIVKKKHPKIKILSST